MSETNTNTSIQKFEVQAISFETEFSEVDAIVNKWADGIPDASDAAGDALCRAGAREAQQLRKRITDKAKAVKDRINGFKTDLTKLEKELCDRLLTTEDMLRAEYRRVEQIKQQEKEERERAEQMRVAALRQKLADIQGASFVQFGTPLDEIESKLAAVVTVEITKEEHQEFFAECHAARDASIAALRMIIESEKMRIENERIRAEEAARLAEMLRIEQARIDAENKRLAEERA